MHDREAATFFHTYKRLPLEVVRGEGVYLFTSDGKRYLDMFAGLAVNALGYAHPRVVEAIRAQASRYTHLSNYFLQEPQVRLAEMLTGLSGYPRVFFSNSGTEAIEGAIKIARKWAARNSTAATTTPSDRRPRSTFSFRWPRSSRVSSSARTPGKSRF